MSLLLGKVARRVRSSIALNPSISRNLPIARNFNAKAHVRSFWHDSLKDLDEKDAALIAKMDFLSPHSREWNECKSQREALARERQTANEKKGRREKVLASIAVFVSIATILTLIIDRPWNRLKIVNEWRILTSTADSQRKALTKAYINRDEENAIARPTAQRYQVIIGPRGCGKSTLVERKIENQSGVATVSVGEKVNLFELIATGFGVDVEKYSCPTEKELCQLLSDATWWKRLWKPHWLPTIVIEVESATPELALVQLAKDLKKIVIDRDAAHGILVLSDSNGQFALPQDPARQKIIWVDDMTEEQAIQYVEKLLEMKMQKEVDQKSAAIELKNIDLKNEVFAKIGTRPLLLKEVFSEEDWKGVIETNISKAEREIVALLGKEKNAEANKMGVPIREMLLQLIQKGSVRAGSFKNIASSPRDLVPLMKASHCILYHEPSGCYRFYSRAHQVAAQMLYKRQPELFGDPKKS